MTDPSGEPSTRELFLNSGDRTLHKWHHYFEFYDRFFGPLRHSNPTLLEIGIQRGGSLRMWRKFFGPGARIIGADIDPGCAALASEGFPIHIGDQANAGFLQQLVRTYGRFDIVIDDGGHTANQQITTFEQLYGACTKVYLVEDTHTSYWRNWHDRPDGKSFITYTHELIHRLHEWHFAPPSFYHYGKDPASRGADPEVSAFCRTTKSITVTDSMVFFEKGTVAPRFHEVR